MADGAARRTGVHQAVILNLAPTGPSYGSLADDPPFMSDEWWTLFLGACDDASELGFELWPYDQIGFSGANVQGRLVGADSGRSGRALRTMVCEAESGDVCVLQAPDGATPVAAYFVPDDPDAPSLPVAVEHRGASSTGEAGELVLVFSEPHGFDYFSIEASSALIDAVFGEYERRAGQWFGSVIGGFFQDELPAMPTWSHDFAAVFEARFGYDIAAHVSALWGHRLPSGASVAAWRVRLDYHRLRAELAQSAFFSPLAEWYSAAGLVSGFDQQSPAREGDPSGTVAVYGDYLSTHSRFGAPGSDHWGDAKLHSSLAHARGRGERVWLEAFHSTGWGGTLEETYDWLSPFIRRGATQYNPHAVYYSTRSGFWEWAPPSTCWRQPYWPDYHLFAGALRRLFSVLSQGSHVASSALIFPTEELQAHVTAGGRDISDGRSSSTYHELNGRTPWHAERPGILDRAGNDYDILSNSSLRSARVEDGLLLVGAEAYVNLIVPAVGVLDASTARLALELARSGGRVVFIGRLPDRFPTSSGNDEGMLEELQSAIGSGAITVLEDGADVPSVLLRLPVTARADVPLLHRRCGANHVFVLTAHDDSTGTVQPILPDFDYDWVEKGFDWQRYWNHLRTVGYEFRPVGDRRFTLAIHGLEPGVSAQRWNPRTGARSDIRADYGDNGEVIIESDFRDGTIALLVVGPDLPAPTAPSLHEAQSVVQFVDNWSVLASSTLENRWGDVASHAEESSVPVEVWRFEHAEFATESPPDLEQPHVWATAIATFGPFAMTAGPIRAPPSRERFATAGWAPSEWSLSRGIHKDPINHKTLGPNGYVPEEFIDWDHVNRGDWVAVTTVLDLSSVNGSEECWIAVGSGAARRLFLDGVEQPVEGEGFLSSSPLAGRGLVTLDLWLSPEYSGDVRAYFAIVDDREAFARPEWIQPDDGSAVSTTVNFRTTFDYSDAGEDLRMQLATESPAILTVNGRVVGRQGSFEPYEKSGNARVLPYDLSGFIRHGENEIEIAVIDAGRTPSILVDTIPAERGGLGFRTDTSWSITRETQPVALRLRRVQGQDARYFCLMPRPHPLQDATWLEPESASDHVVRTIPRKDAEGSRVELLRFLSPIGAKAIDVPSDLPFTVLAGPAHSVDGSRILLDEAAGEDTTITLCFSSSDGRHGGALLSAPLAVSTEAVKASLRSWPRLGLESLGGEVRYEASVPADFTLEHGERLVVDLGSVRGTATVCIDDEAIDTLLWSPWRVDVTDWLTRSAARRILTVIVRGTLGPYMKYATPSPAVMKGQESHGLFGPVRLEKWSTGGYE